MIHHSGSLTARGFTLIELVTTLVIIGILSAVAIPKMFDNQAFRERGYVDEVASAFRYAQKIAIASQCEVRIVVDPGGYNVMQRDTFANCNDAAASWATPVLRSDGSNLLGTTPAEVILTPAATIIFDGEGGVSNGDPPILTAGIFTLTVDRNSGLVTIVP